MGGRRDSLGRPRGHPFVAFSSGGQLLVAAYPEQTETNSKPLSTRWEGWLLGACFSSGGEKDVAFVNSGAHTHLFEHLPGGANRRFKADVTGRRHGATLAEERISLLEASTETRPFGGYIRVQTGGFGEITPSLGQQSIAGRPRVLAHRQIRFDPLY